MTTPQPTTVLQGRFDVLNDLPMYTFAYTGQTEQIEKPSYRLEGEYRFKIHIYNTGQSNGNPESEI
jgi:hypothetical protein